MAIIDIYCIDNSRSDIVGWIDSALTPGDIGIRSVRDMVRKICWLCAAGDRIGELRIAGHGDANGQCFGRDWIDSTTLPRHRTQLARLHPLFASSGEGLVSLVGCQVGQNGALLLDLSNILGVPVRAWTAWQRPIVHGDEGSETRCFITCTRGSRSNFWDWLDN